jgi:cell division protein FtsB
LGKKKVIVLSIFGLILLGAIFIPGYVRFRKLAKLLREQERQIEEVKENNKRLEEELEKLKNDPLYLEKVAREKLGVARKGEIIYRVLPAQQNQ